MERLDRFHHPKFGDLPVYQEWDDIPAQFVTETGLKERGKRKTPLQRPVAVVQTRSRSRQRHDLLYDLTETIDKRPYTARQKAALQRVKERNTCDQCGVAFVTLSPDGYCGTCQALLERRHKARSEAIRWAQKTSRQPFLILDTETTGLSPVDRIVEIAVLDETGKAVLSTLIHPGMTIPIQATSIHGITNEMVREKPMFLDILPDLENLLTDKPVVVYNAAFDTRFLARGGLKVGDYSFQCAMLMYAKFVGKWSDHHQSWRRQSLQAACAHCGIPYQTVHRAVADCEATRQVLYHMAKTSQR